MLAWSGGKAMAFRNAWPAAWAWLSLSPHIDCERSIDQGHIHGRADLLPGQSPVNRSVTPTCPSMLAVPG